jgi:hypothetical protein
MAHASSLEMMPHQCRSGRHHDFGSGLLAPDCRLVLMQSSSRGGQREPDACQKGQNDDRPCWRATWELSSHQAPRTKGVRRSVSWRAASSWYPSCHQSAPYSVNVVIGHRSFLPLSVVAEPRFRAGRSQDTTHRGKEITTPNYHIYTYQQARFKANRQQSKKLGIAVLTA